MPHSLAHAAMTGGVFRNDSEMQRTRQLRPSAYAKMEFCLPETSPRPAPTMAPTSQDTFLITYETGETHVLGAAIIAPPAYLATCSALSASANRYSYSCTVGLLPVEPEE